MTKSFANVNIHLIFSTKDRTPFIRDAGFREQLHAWLGGVSRKNECAPILIGGVEDHVHMLCKLSRSLALADWVKELKQTSNVWARRILRPVNGKLAWQIGYGAFSVSESNVESVKDYIARQEEHHRKESFKDEFRAFLRKHRIEWDERYIWD